MATGLRPLHAAATPPAPPDPDEQGEQPLLEGVRGLRDLGGMPTRDGGVTRPGLLFRSPCPSDLTEADREALEDLGLALRIDLRASFEVREAPAADCPGVALAHVPVLDADDASSYVRRLVDALGPRRDPAAVLQALLRLEGAAFARAFALVARRTPALVHCTTGRDRTGLFAALALRLARVDDALIALDYAASASSGSGEAVLDALDLLDSEWEGAEGYLLDHGLGADELRAFHTAFVAP
jgi:protein-tyrosine phosphatase